MKNIKCSRSIAQNDIRVGVSLYAILVYCNTEAINMFHFQMNLLKSSTKRNIIQATKNNIVLENFAEYENQENVKYFYLALNRKLGLELGNVLGSLYPTSEVKSMKDMGWPFFDNYQKCIIDR